MFRISLVLGLAAISMGLLILAVALRSRSVATLNFLVCFASAIVIQPWLDFSIRPPSDPEQQTYWVGTMVWMATVAIGLAALIYCRVITGEKKPTKRRKRRRRSKSSRDRAHDESVSRQGGISPGGG